MPNRKMSQEILVKLTITTLITISIIVLILTQATVVHAADQALMVSPAQGPVNTYARIIGMGFPSNSPVTVTFESTQVGSAYPGIFGRIDTGFQIPNLPLGTYTITATSQAGGYATTTFTITEKTSTSSTTSTSSAAITLSTNKGTAGTIVTVTGSGFSYGASVNINFDAVYQAKSTADNSGKINCAFTIPSLPPGTYTISATSTTRFASAPFTITSSTQGTGLSSNKTTTAKNTEFWSPTTIALVGAIVAVATILPLTFIYRRRNKQEIISSPVSQDNPTYKPKPPTQPKKPMATSLYDRPTSYSKQITQKNTASIRTQPTSYSYQTQKKPTMPPTYKAASSYKLQTTATKTCRYCKQTVRDDYNTCPNCHKKLR